MALTDDHHDDGRRRSIRIRRTESEALAPARGRRDSLRPRCKAPGTKHIVFAFLRHNSITKTSYLVFHTQIDYDRIRFRFWIYIYWSKGMKQPERLQQFEFVLNFGGRCLMALSHHFRAFDVLQFLEIKVSEFQLLFSWLLCHWLDLSRVVCRRQGAVISAARTRVYYLFAFLRTVCIADASECIITFISSVHNEFVTELL
jgi:hypothetical protein